MKILWQSSTPVHRYPSYVAAVERHAMKILAPGSSIVVRGVQKGCDQLAYQAFDMLNNIHVFDSVVRAEREGFDAVAIGCFLDPALDPLREIVDIPIVSLAETGMLTACMLGKRFSILSHNRLFNRKAYPELVEKYKLMHRACPWWTWNSRGKSSRMHFGRVKSIGAWRKCAAAHARPSQVARTRSFSVAGSSTSLPPRTACRKWTARRSSM